MVPQIFKGYQATMPTSKFLIFSRLSMDGKEVTDFIFIKRLECSQLNAGKPSEHNKQCWNCHWAGVQARRLNQWVSAS